MPYIEVDEVPEGTEAVDVVTRADYDGVVTERDETAAQRDEALNRIRDMEAEVRAVRAMYADAILGASQAKAKPRGDSNRSEQPKLSMSTAQLFG